MPILQIPIAARDLVIEAARTERQREQDGEDTTYAMGYHSGVLDGLRALLPSEVVGILIMDRDCALDGEELYSECLPRLVIGLTGSELARDPDGEETGR